MRMLLILASLLALTSNHATARQPEPIRYALSFPDAANHYVNVDVALSGISEPQLELMMAVWTPGSYLVREHARHVDSVSARTADGTRLDIRKTRKNRWSVTTNGAADVVVSYRLYCHEMSVRTNWVDRDFALFNGAATYMTLAETKNRRHEVTVQLPAGWQQAICPLPTLEGQPPTFIATSFDELVDSPLLVGNPRTEEFDAGGRPHLLVHQGDDSFWDLKQAAKDVRTIVLEHQKMWGVVPYPRYVFFNIVSETGGGLEHDNSTVLMTSRWRFRVKRDYKRWLTLVSHEFFHTWNVRRLRPRGLRDYDYETENYTDSLWIAEGITSYYEGLALARCGLLTRDEFLDQLSGDINSVERAPGKNVQSLRESSHDTWIKFYRPDENSHNTRVSYYSKGAVAAFLLDAEIRRSTDNARSLDDVMRIMFQRYAGKGYLPEDFRAVVAEVAQAELSDWFRVHIDTAAPMQYEPALTWYGLALTPPDDKKDEDKEDENDDKKKADDGKAWTGFSVSSDNGRASVSRVIAGSPAADAGLNVGDEVIALDGYRVTADDLDSRLRQYKPGTVVPVLISRRQQILTLPLTLGTAPKALKLRLLKKPTEQQDANLRSWLHQPEKKKPKKQK